MGRSNAFDGERARAVMMEAGRTFPPDLSTPGEARRFIGNVLDPARTDEETSHLALVLTSELVTNAVLHAGTSLHVRVQLEDDQLRIEVSDGDTALPSPSAAPIDASSGRGLFLVEALAATWGATPAPEGAGKVVWFTLPHCTRRHDRSGHTTRAGQSAPAGRTGSSSSGTRAGSSRS